MGMKQTDVKKITSNRTTLEEVVNAYEDKIRKDQEDTRKGSMNVRKQSAIQVAN